MENTTNEENNIENLMAMIKQGKKHTAISAIADHFDMAFTSVKTAWLSKSGGYSVPDDKRDKVIEILQNTVRLQNEGIEVKDPIALPSS